MADEHYILLSGAKPYVLDGSFRPAQLMPTAYTPNLVRGRGSTRIYDLGDGIPAPAPLVLTGTMSAEREDDLAYDLARLREAVWACIRVTRNNRAGVEIQGGSVVAIPISDNSAEAQVVITLIPLNVPLGGFHDW